MEQARYWIAVLLVISLLPAVGWWFLLHPFVRFWRRVGVRGTLTVATTCLLASMAGLFWIRDSLLGPDLGTHVAPIAFAVPLLTASVIIQRKRRKLLTTRILTGVPEVASERGGRLITEGIYSRVRHPRYVEFTLGSVGWALLANHAGAYLVCGVTIALIYVVVLLEERELKDRFGAEYEEYSRRVPRFFPHRSR